MRKLILILPLFLLNSCGPTKCPLSSFPAEDRGRYNTEEPTLQSAEDASTKAFTEESFK
jgi:hypothetical protein